MSGRLEWKVLDVVDVMFLKLRILLRSGGLLLFVGLELARW